MADRRLPRLLACLVAGVATALSLPPWGWWPLALMGLGVLAWATEGMAPWRARFTAGAAFGVGMFLPGLWWMNEFHALGGLVVVVLEAAFVAAAVALAPPTGPLRAFALPAALVLAELVRGVVPFGGLPMAGVPLGQVAGPLGGAARLGGQLLVLALAAAAGAALADAARRRLVVGGTTAGVVLAVALLAAVAPDGGDPERTIDVAVVQGGGRRGFRAVDTDPRGVFDAHMVASERVRRGVDLVLWPEDVVDVPGPIADVPESAELAALADSLDTTLVAGVVEDVSGTRFNNAAVAWGPDGLLLDRYDKVHRVPFGEYVPGRRFIERFADLGAIPRDAVPGARPNRLDTPAGPLGVVISFEVFFPDRARAAVRHGGKVLLVPTNAASFTTSQVPTTEVAAARLRAVETGRDLVQAAPTGYGAVIDHRGRVRARTTLGRQEVVHRRVALRDGRTIYASTGDWPMLVLALAGVLLGRRKVDRAVNDGQP